ncbi:MAG: minichromosome maintenance protein MCM [Methanoregula sp.]|nr:minichromosome maintenance protein MCM [Methanoregula sp.]
MDKTPDLQESDKTGDWSRLLKSRYKKELGEISREYPHKRSLYIDYKDIERFGKAGIAMADELLENPGKVLEDVGEAVKSGQLIRTKDGKEPKGINIRFKNLPVKTGIRKIRSDDINTFVSIEGTLRKTTEVRPRMFEAVFKCPAGHFTVKKQKFGKYIEPDGCATDGCAFKKLELLPKRSKFVDSQKLRIQESPEGLRGGEQPQTLDVDITDDISGQLSPGERVTVNGILRSVQRMNKGEKSTVFDIFLECNSFERAEKEFDEVDIDEEAEDQIMALSKDPRIYHMVTQSVAPTIYGSNDVKQAIVLQMFGGIRKEMPDGTSLRGDIHVLLVGDPGIAKSQLLRYVVKLSPRAIYTSGQSSTSAGLTATAVKDEFGEGRWTLEAGALVLADMGIAAVDEMDKMQKEDRSALHEAMEQQTISVAKAGITATLRSRCALLGAANPKLGRFDMFGDISDQINMPPSLLSRFDLIFIMPDQPEQKRDLAIAEHILKTHTIGEKIEQNKKTPIPGVTPEYIQQQLKPVMPDIEPALFRKYIAYAKRTCFPILSIEAKDAIIKYYLSLRGLAEPNKAVPVTARQLEALVRLAEASARIRLSKDIEISDAERVIHIMDTCLRQVAYDAKTGTFDIDKVTTGISKEKRDLVRTIKDAIRDIGGEGKRAGIEQVIDAVASKGFGRDKARESVEMLLRNGEAMEPKQGIIQLI